MNAPSIPLAEPCMGEREAAYAADALARNQVCQGDYLPRFERAVADYCAVRHAVAVSSGTAALHLALLVAGVRWGDEVIVPALSFIAPANAVRYCGAHPVFLDVDREHWTLSRWALAEFLATCEVREFGQNLHVVNPRTGRTVRAVLPVHLLGHPTRMQSVADLAEEHGLAVVADATESLGARYCGTDPAGYALLSCLSFNGNKLITTGGGGMVLTDDGDLAKRVRYLANQAKDDPAEYVHHEVGYNYRLSNVQAAIGCAQMERIEDFLVAKSRITHTYRKELADVPGIGFQQTATWAQSSHWLSTILVDESEYGMCARQLRDRLAREGIESRTLWMPLHLDPANAAYYVGPLPVAERLYQMALSLPSSVGLTEEDQQRVIEAIRRR